jgi:transposase-like protein
MPFQKWQKFVEQAQERGLSAAQALDELYSQPGANRVTVAKRLGVKKETLSRWINRAGCKTVSRVICDAEVESAK